MYNERDGRNFQFNPGDFSYIFRKNYKAYYETPTKGIIMPKLPSLSDNQKVVVAVAARVIVPLVAIVVTDVLVKKMSKDA